MFHGMFPHQSSVNYWTILQLFPEFSWGCHGLAWLPLSSLGSFPSLAWSGVFGGGGCSSNFVKKTTLAAPLLGVSWLGDDASQLVFPLVPALGQHFFPAVQGSVWVC